MYFFYKKVQLQCAIALHCNDYLHLIIVIQLIVTLIKLIVHEVTESYRSVVLLCVQWLVCVCNNVTRKIPLYRAFQTHLELDFQIKIYVFSFFSFDYVFISERIDIITFSHFEVGIIADHIALA